MKSYKYRNPINIEMIQKYAGIWNFPQKKSNIYIFQFSQTQLIQTKIDQNFNLNKKFKNKQKININPQEKNMELYKIIEKAKESENLPREKNQIQNKNQIHLKHFPGMQSETSTGSKSDSQQNQSNNLDSIQLLQLQQLKLECIQFINIKQLQLLTEPNSKKWVSQRSYNQIYTKSCKNMNCSIYFAVEETLQAFKKLNQKHFSTKDQLKTQILYALELLENKNVYLISHSLWGLSKRELHTNCRKKVQQVVNECMTVINNPSSSQNISLDYVKVYLIMTCIQKLQSLQNTLLSCKNRAFKPFGQEKQILKKLKKGLIVKGNKQEQLSQKKDINQKQCCLCECLKKIWKNIFPEKKILPEKKEEQTRKDQMVEQQMSENQTVNRQVTVDQELNQWKDQKKWEPSEYQYED